MLNHDISARAARRMLSSSAPDDQVVGPAGWTRRRFLQAVGLGVAGGAAVGALGEGLVPGEVAEVFAGTPVGPTDGIVVNIMLYGGNDGLNTVVPYTDGNYYTQRGSVSIAPGSVLPIGSGLGLHPSLAFVKSLYDAGQVAIVQGVGYPVPDLSHFTSMAIWMNGRFSGAPTSGWLGRWLDGQSPAIAELAVAAIDSSVPLHLIGDARRAVAVSPYGDMFGSGASATDRRMYDGVRAMSAASAGRGQWHDMFAATMRTQLDVARDVAPAFVGQLPSRGLVRKLTVAARLINADIGLRVLDVALDGFDDHDSQLGQHASLLTELDAALLAFYDTLLPQWRDRVVLITQSEFGRTPWSNESGGTDHGTASDLFVIGSKVRGGLHGQRPTLAGLRRWDRMAHHVDFRSVFGTVIDGWLGGGGSTVVNGAFEPLALFTSGPTGSVTPPAGTVVVLPPAASSGFTAISPTRVLDTRDGTGGRSGPLGPQEAWKFTMAGRAGVPTDAVAVALNLTAVDATTGTFVTAHPYGEARPLSSNLNPAPGSVSPNLVVVRLGLDGALVLYNNSGTVHLVADVVGFFTPSSDVGLLALDPCRLLDTRDGTGDRLGALGQGEWMEFAVAGRGGVPTDAQAVALNVTVTEPTAPSYLTVWPAGEDRPVASSVNMAPGQTVPNMVLARLGEGGRIAIYNNTGSSQVVVDVLGAFVPGAPARFVPVSPSRALDTREGVGAPRARLRGGALDVGLTGRSGVPGSGVSAVLLNVTAVTPSAGTYVTVFPSGRGRPLASNLNVDPGQVVPNMVLARLGSNGAASMYNNAGEVDLVGDVMGYFTT